MARAPGGPSAPGSLTPCAVAPFRRPSPSTPRRRFAGRTPCCGPRRALAGWLPWAGPPRALARTWSSWSRWVEPQMPPPSTGHWQRPSSRAQTSRRTWAGTNPRRASRGRADRLARTCATSTTSSMPWPRGRRGAALLLAGEEEVEGLLQEGLGGGAGAGVGAGLAGGLELLEEAAAHRDVEAAEVGGEGDGLVGGAGRRGGSRPAGREEPRPALAVLGRGARRAKRPVHAGLHAAVGSDVRTTSALEGMAGATARTTSRSGRARVRRQLGDQLPGLPGGEAEEAGQHLRLVLGGEHLGELGGAAQAELAGRGGPRPPRGTAAPGGRRRCGGRRPTWRGGAGGGGTRRARRGPARPSRGRRRRRRGRGGSRPSPCARRRGARRGGRRRCGRRGGGRAEVMRRWSHGDSRPPETHQEGRWRTIAGGGFDGRARRRARRQERAEALPGRRFRARTQRRSAICRESSQAPWRDAPSGLSVNPPRRHLP